MNLWRALKNITRKSKPTWATQCREIYRDREGFRYYQYVDELDMSIYRKGEIEKSQMELRYGMDYSDVVQGVKRALNKSDKRTGKMAPDIATAGYLTQELIDRNDLLIVPDILFRLAANTLIREDENPYLIDGEILEQKISTFKREIQRGGLYDFFQTGDLLRSIGLSNISHGGFNRLMADSEQRINQIRAQIKLFTSEQGSSDFSSNKTSSISKRA